MVPQPIGFISLLPPTADFNSAPLIHDRGVAVVSRNQWLGQIFPIREGLSKPAAWKVENIAYLVLTGGQRSKFFHAVDVYLSQLKG